LSGLAAGLALVGLLSGLLALRSRLLKAHLLLATFVVGLSAFMLTLASTWFWQIIPMLSLIQLPFRFLSAACLWLALLAGAACAAMLTTLPRLVAIVVAGGLSLALGLYVLAGPPIALHPPDTPTSSEDALQFERESQAMGLQAVKEYLPNNVIEIPPAVSGPGVGQSRLDETSLPWDAQIVSASYSPLRYSLALESSRSFQVIFKTFYFPGWKARLSGEPVPVAPSGSYGLISLPIPAGEHQVEIYFGSTPVRSAAAAVSLACLAVLLGLIILERKYIIIRRKV
jgi:hypothetical protein